MKITNLKINQKDKSFATVTTETGYLWWKKITHDVVIYTNGTYGHDLCFIWLESGFRLQHMDNLQVVRLDAWLTFQERNKHIKEKYQKLIKEEDEGQ